MNPLLEFPVIFWELLSSPWTNLDVAWGIIPLYLSLLVGEIYEAKPSPKNAVQGGANLLWAGLDWGRVSLLPLVGQLSDLWKGQNLLIATMTFFTIALGIVSVFVGLRKRKRKLGKYFRYVRFSGYFVIMLYPLQTNVVPWYLHGWMAVLTILIFAVPVWLCLGLVFQGIFRLK